MDLGAAKRDIRTRLSCSGYASTCRGQFDTATRRADGSPASYGDMTLKSVPSRCTSRTSSTSTISRTCLGKRSLLGTVPMAESAGEPAILHRLDELPLVRAPCGVQPQDGVWRTRGGLWINRHGMALYEADAGESDSADDDELDAPARGCAPPVTSLSFLERDGAFRRWRRRDPSCTFDAFSAGPWQRTQGRRRRRRQNQRRRDELPCEVQARGTARPRYLDRMPTRARAAPLIPPNGLLGWKEMPPAALPGYSKCSGAFFSPFISMSAIRSLSLCLLTVCGAFHSRTLADKSTTVARQRSRAATPCLSEDPPE